MADDKNYVSVWFWMFAMFVAAIPCVGLVMIVIWAFVGENQSRKNFFRAMILWALIVSGMWVLLALLGVLPAAYAFIQQRISEAHYWAHWPKP